MASRNGPGPVFAFESLIFARRWQVYAGRAAFVLAVLIGLWIAWWSNLNSPVGGGWVGSRPGTLQALARVGQAFFYALAGIQLTMMLLVAPAATAGAICHDRARGILAQMATTELSDAEIVLGKLFSRLVPIMGLLACALPVTALAALLGGIDIQALFSLFAVSAAVAVLGSALALSISVQVAKTHEVIMAVMALWTFWLLSPPIWSGMARTYGLAQPPDWVYNANPYFLVYAPYSWPGSVGLIEIAAFVGGALAISAGLAAQATRSLRRAVLPVEAGRRAGRRWLRGLRWPDVSRWFGWLPGPSLDGNPVLWREWHRARPSRMARILWGTFWLGAIAGTGIGIEEAIAHGLDTPTGGFVLITSLILQSCLGLMLLSGQAPTSLGEERVRGSLDVLMATPLSTRAIFRGKWLATYRIVLRLAILPGLAAVILAFAVPSIPARFLTPGMAVPINVIPITLVDRLATPVLVVAEFLSYGAAITSLGLALATWIRRPGRAIAINVFVFVLIAVGWPFGVEAFIWRPLTSWLSVHYNVSGPETRWLMMGLMTISPLLGPAMTLSLLSDPWMGGRSMFGLVALVWCLLACMFAGGLYWAALRSFDRCLGRMRETSQPDGRDESARTVVEEPSDEPLVPSLTAASPSLAAGNDGFPDDNR